MPSRISDARPSLATRARLARRRRLRLVAALVALAMVAGAALWLVALSPVFALRTVEVTGAKVLTADRVRAAAQAPVGRPLSRVDTAAITQRVAALPAVERVEVDRRWPHDLVISVVERRAVVQVSRSGGFAWVDASGIAFNEVGQPTSGLVQASLAKQDARSLRDVATVAAALSPTLRPQVSSIVVAGPDAIQLKLSGNRTVVWGSADQSPVKSQVTTAMLKVKASVYDVSSPANPTSR